MLQAKHCMMVFWKLYFTASIHIFGKRVVVLNTGTIVMISIFVCHQAVHWLKAGLEQHTGVEWHSVLWSLSSSSTPYFPFTHYWEKPTQSDEGVRENTSESLLLAACKITHLIFPITQTLWLLKNMFLI